MCGRKGFSISLALVASLVLSPVALAQVRTVPTADWSGLKTLTSGSNLAVKLRNGKTANGKLGGLSDTALSLSVSGKPMDLSRGDVLSVYEISWKSAKKSTLIGLGLGAGTGAAIGTAVGDGFIINKGQAAAGLGILGAGVGALVGFLVGKRGDKRVLIYEAKQP